MAPSRGSAGRPSARLAPSLAAPPAGPRSAHVERTLAWMSRFRRLAIRYERRTDIHHAFIALACSLICLNALQGRFWKALALLKTRLGLTDLGYRYGTRAPEVADAEDVEVGAACRPRGAGGRAGGAAARRQPLLAARLHPATALRP